MLNDINTRLPLLTDANHITINRVEKMIESAERINSSERSKIAAVQRALDKKAPFHISKNSVADAIIIEQFYEFSQSLDNSESCLFVTHNHNDFSAKDHRKYHPDFADIFRRENNYYFNNLASAINYIDEDYLPGGVTQKE